MLLCDVTFKGKMRHGRLLGIEPGKGAYIRLDDGIDCHVPVQAVYRAWVDVPPDAPIVLDPAVSDGGLRE